MIGYPESQSGNYLNGNTVDQAVTNALVEALDGLTKTYASADISTWLAPDMTMHWAVLGAAGVRDTPCMNRGRYNELVSLGEGSAVSAQDILPPGESGDVRSPHFADQPSLYASWQYKPMLVRPADVARFAPVILPRQ